MKTKTNNRNFNPKGNNEPGLTKEIWLSLYEDYRDGLTMVADKDHYEELQQLLKDIRAVCNPDRCLSGCHCEIVRMIDTKGKLVYRSKVIGRPYPALE